MKPKNLILPGILCHCGFNRTTYLELTDTLIALSGNHSIIGRAVVVHKGQDDLVSQSTSNAGGRVACGVIGIVQ